ncbi:class I SAM-dependent methyltransferase [Laspinema olomoucense]|uniref:class I SAM-dependent methyltransferase n=1 Tax=Laspinema olomoucense TaxID=3231600 RepID=UPI0021BB27A1|nr:class I SAM-dependent methyltransferase [Laspinema sp. D3a]MCT7990064.1 class I SAM-dependent methyltransferase [Laspinema sp. D3a]
MENYQEIYKAEQLPILQNRMFPTETEAKNCTKGDIILVQDLETGLIFNRAFQPELMDYDIDYQNEQAISKIFQNHLNQVKEIIQQHFAGQSLIEVGCGKGYFLEVLQKSGFQIYGFDPTYEGSNPDIIKDFFTPDIRIQGDGIILRHVLEHIHNPIEFCSKIRDTNGGGKIYIEVPCFDWIIKHRAWFDIFYEHVNYFRMSDFYRIFDTIYESGYIFGEQYLYVVADLNTLKIPVNGPDDRIEFPEYFLDTVNRYANYLTSKPSPNSAVWGGASKGVIFSLFMQRFRAKIDIVIDINSVKHGKYLPATGIQVYPPEKAIKHLASGADIFVMNSNYLPEIIELTSNQYNYLTVEHGKI